MSKQPAPSPVRVPDALMSAMGFPVAELNPGLTSPFVSAEDREFAALASRLAPCLAAGRAAYGAKLAEVGDVGTCGFAWVAVEIAPETKPAIRWLNAEDHGRIDGCSAAIWMRLARRSG